MKKKDPSSKKSATALDLKAFEDILERTTDILEKRIVGGVKSELATKEELKEEVKLLATKEELAQMEKNIIGQMGDFFDRYMKVHQKAHERVETRLSKLEETVFSPN